MPPTYVSGFGSSVAPTGYLDKLGSLDLPEGYGSAVGQELLKAFAAFRAGLTGAAPSALAQAATRPEEVAGPPASMIRSGPPTANAGNPTANAAIMSRNPAVLGAALGYKPPVAPQEAGPASGTLMFSLDKNEPLRAYDPTFSYNTYGSTRMSRLGIAGPPSPAESGAAPMSGANGPNVSFIQGTPEIQARLATEAAMRARGLNQATAEARSYEIPQSTPDQPNPMGLTRDQLTQLLMAQARTRQDPTLEALQYGQGVARAARTELEMTISQLNQLPLSPEERAARISEATERWKTRWAPSWDALALARGVQPQPSYER